MMRLEELDQLKNPYTPSGFEPATFLNQLRYRVPQILEIHFGKLPWLTCNELLKIRTTKRKVNKITRELIMR
jgi:hypothetical protein